MARRKNQLENEADVAEKAIAPVETTIIDADGALPETIKELTPTPIQQSQEIPTGAMELLKTFSNLPELLITPQGGVYMPGCKLAAAKAAILYKNPFYNL